MNIADTADVIHAALQHDPDIDLDRYPITIRVDDVVHMEGQVADIIAKRKAVRLAQSVANKPPINDRLHVVRNAQMTENELRDHALKALRGESAFSDMDIDIGTGTDTPSDRERDWVRIAAKDCVLRLTGEVNSLSHRRLAEVIVWWMPGVCDVDNRLHVRPPEAECDEEISDAVRLVFDKEPALDAGQISIVTRDREVTLRGAVFSDVEKRIATKDCWYIPGVHAVHNELHVLPRQS